MFQQKIKFPAFWLQGQFAAPQLRDFAGGAASGAHDSAAKRPGTRGLTLPFVQFQGFVLDAK